MQRSMIKLLSLADVITLTNAIFGFLAIVILFSDSVFSDDIRIRLSFSFILIALLADGIDGIIARKTRKGELGEYLEAMADMTSLGIAPSVFIYTIYHDIISVSGNQHVFLIVACILFLVMSVIRLASFHILKEKNFFVGLPSSASTMIVIILAFLEIELLFILPVIVIISIALVSNIHFPKPGFKVNALAALLIILALIIGKNYGNIALYFLFISLLVYSLIGPFYLKQMKK